MPSCHLWLDHVQFTLIHGTNITGSYAIVFFTALGTTFASRHIQNWVSFPLWPSHFVLSGAISKCPLLFSGTIPGMFWHGGVHLLVEYLLTLSYYLWGSCSNNTGVGCHFLLQWTTFCQIFFTMTCPFGWLCMDWLIASLNYTSPLVMKRLWSMKGTLNMYMYKVCICYMSINTK